MYPPSIAVLDPEVFVCVEPACAGPPQKVKRHSNIINTPEDENIQEYYDIYQGGYYP